MKGRRTNRGSARQQSNEETGKLSEELRTCQQHKSRDCSLQLRAEVYIFRAIHPLIRIREFVRQLSRIVYLYVCTYICMGKKKTECMKERERFPGERVFVKVYRPPHRLWRVRTLAISPSASIQTERVPRRPWKER